MHRVARLKASGCCIIALLALNDEGAPSYDREIAGQFARVDIPAFACTPDQFPELMAVALKNEDIQSWMAREGVERK